MNLTVPSQVTFILSVFLAVLALLVRYADVAIPVVSNHSFETLVNPYDPDSVASAIARALYMPQAERHDRHGVMLARLAQHGGAVWSTHFLQSLERTQMIAETSLEGPSVGDCSRKFRAEIGAISVT
jgi:hypothetical protein